MRFLAEVPSRAAAAVASFLCFAGGLGLVAGGAYLIEPAAGLIVAGASLVTCAVLYEQAAARRTRSRGVE